MKYQFLISAPSSNSGKTTVTLGLIRLLMKQGLQVQVFKCGPDYIDTKFLGQAAQRPAINLDIFMMGNDHVKELYEHYSASADVSIIEGVMGLFDGANRMEGSSAEIAMLLNVPVIMVLPAKASAYSVAPVLYGFKNFNQNITIAGVIFNHVNTPSHYNFLKDAAHDAGVSSLGYIPVNDQIKIPSRHLGLKLEQNSEDIVSAIATHLEKTVSIEHLLSVTARIESVKPSIQRYGYAQQERLTITIAQDEAFTFTYHQNIEFLRTMYDVVLFSPLHDTVLPEADIVYLAGGYPELFLEQLSANIPMRKSLAHYCDAGGKVLAECGGLMYLGKSILNANAEEYETVGFLDLKTSMAEKALTLGYRVLHYKDKVYRGHEFHYSSITTAGIPDSIGDIRNAKGEEVKMKLYRKKNVVASYMHFYWGDGSDLFETIFSSRLSE
jgi:cobyrinic acid a,c-diamide synthase